MMPSRVNDVFAGRGAFPPLEVFDFTVCDRAGPRSGPVNDVEI